MRVERQVVHAQAVAELPVSQELMPCPAGNVGSQLFWELFRGRSCAGVARADRFALEIFESVWIAKENNLV